MLEECMRPCEQPRHRPASLARTPQEIVLETKQVDASNIDQFLGAGF